MVRPVKDLDELHPGGKGRIVIQKMPAKENGRSPCRRSVTKTFIAVVGALALTFGTATMAAAVEIPEGDEGVVATETTESLDSGSEGQESEGSESESAEEVTEGEVSEEAAEVAEEEEVVTEDLGEGEGSESELQLESFGVEPFGMQSESKDRGNDKHDDKVKLCHATGKGWVVLNVDKNGAVAGHAGWHHQKGMDIIPPFSYKKGWQTVNFPGQNWDEQGQAIWNNDCQKPPTPPNISVYVEQCTVPGGEPSGTVLVSLGDLKKGQHYTVMVSQKWKTISSQKIVAYGPTAQLDMAVAGAGDYSATVTQKGSQLSGSTEFQVLPCPPLPELAIYGEAGECVVTGGTGTAIVTVTGLLSDGVYVVDLWFGEELVGTQMIEYPEDSSAVLTFEVTEFGDYTAQVTGETVMVELSALRWKPQPEPEPAPSASVVFQAGEGCPVPVTPVVQPTPPVLAATGADIPIGAILAGGFLLALGGAMVLTQRARRLNAER